MPTPALSVLKTELATDPKALGYATLKAQTNGNEAVANRINEAGSVPADTIFKSSVLTYELLAEMVYSEYNGWTTAQKSIVDNNPWFRQERIKTGSANMRTTLGAIVPAGASRTNMVAFASRAASRAEFLWGEGTVITMTDVANAYDLP